MASGFSAIDGCFSCVLGMDHAEHHRTPLCAPGPVFFPGGHTDSDIYAVSQSLCSPDLSLLPPAVYPIPPISRLFRTLPASDLLDDEDEDEGEYVGTHFYR